MSATPKPRRSAPTNFVQLPALEKRRDRSDAEARSEESTKRDLAGDKDETCGAGELETPVSRDIGRRPKRRSTETRAVAKEARDCAADFRAKLGLRKKEEDTIDQNI